MILQVFVSLCVILPTSQAELHLRQRNDEDISTVRQLQAGQGMRGKYNNVTEHYFEVGNEEPIYDKIEMCYGDCDSSEDCDDGLFCYHRDLDDPVVPGCSETDYPDLATTNSVCVAQLPEGAWDRTHPIMSKRNLLGMCRGDCDSDRDCESGLVCHQRDWGEAVPGCSGKYLATSRDYCVSPSSSGQRSNLKGECEGDCDSNSDCEGDLVCYQRNAYDPIPTGCRGRIDWSTDYCVKPGNSGGNNNDQRNAVAPAPAPVPSTTTSSSFRLKIYWQPGYNWQGEYFERKWCLTHDYNVGGTCWSGLRRVTCSSNRVYVTTCGNRNQDFNFVSVGNGDVLIKVTGQDRCLTREGVQIALRSCNTNDNNQRFFAPRGDLNGPRFELASASASRFCLNQDHHPKNAEYVQVFPCTWTRSWDWLTSYWEKA